MDNISAMFSFARCPWMSSLFTRSGRDASCHAARETVELPSKQTLDFIAPFSCQQP